MEKSAFLQFLKDDFNSPVQHPASTPAQQQEPQERAGTREGILLQLQEEEQQPKALTFSPYPRVYFPGDVTAQGLSQHHLVTPQGLAAGIYLCVFKQG